MRPRLDFPAIETVADPECGDCLREGTAWVALRQCLECGNVGCCDSSPRRHATAHFHEYQHPVIESAEPAEDWRWCYIHHAHRLSEIFESLRSVETARSR